MHSNYKGGRSCKNLQNENNKIKNYTIRRVYKFLWKNRLLSRRVRIFSFLAQISRWIQNSHQQTFKSVTEGQIGDDKVLKNLALFFSSTPGLGSEQITCARTLCPPPPPSKLWVPPLHSSLFYTIFFLREKIVPWYWPWPKVVWLYLFSLGERK